MQSNLERCAKAAEAGKKRVPTEGKKGREERIRIC